MDRPEPRLFRHHLRLAVLRLAVLRLAVLWLAVLRLAVLRLAVLRQLAVLRAGWQYFVGRRTVGEGKCYVQYMEEALFNCLLQVRRSLSVSLCSSVCLYLFLAFLPFIYFSVLICGIVAAR